MRSQSLKPRFSLSKWYMDCVSAEGDAFVGYAATARFRALVLHYSSALLRRHDQAAEVTTSLQKYSIPAADGVSSTRWSSHPLGIEGNWTATAPPIERMLFESNAGTISWRCLQPRAECRIRFRGREQLDGLGYLEHLTLSIPPWELPIDELRWGRFLANSDAMVWIDWRGAAPLRMVIHNGVEVDASAIEDHHVLLHGGETRLALEGGRVLREGPLISTALSMIPGIRKLFPIRSLQTYECKWLSRGFLREQHKELCTGWAIHEIVRFA